MRILLDTHYLIWAVSADPRLKGKAKVLLEDTSKEIFVSIVSLWEIAIKISLGKLKLEVGFDGLMDQLEILAFEVLPLKISHTQALLELPHLHRDPFDRMLIVQAKVEGLSVLTADPSFGKYGVLVAER